MRLHLFNSGKLGKFRLWVDGNRSLSIGIGLAMLVALVSLAALSLSLTRERRLQEETEAARANAEGALLASQRATHFLEELLQEIQPAAIQGKDTTVLKGLLDRAAGRFDRELTNQPAVEAEMSSLFGHAYQGLGENGSAEIMDRTALALNIKLHGTDSPEAAASLNDLGLTFWKQYNLAEAEMALVDALKIRRHLFGNLNPDVATSLNNLATVYRGERRLVEAESLVRESLEIRQKLFGKESSEVADSLFDLGILLNDEGKHPESEGAASEALEIRKKLSGGRDASVPEEASWTAGTIDRPDDAKSLVMTALSVQRNVLGDESPAVTETLSSFGEILRQRGELTGAETLLRAALSVQRKQLGENNPDTLTTLRRLAGTLKDENKWGEAEIAEREALSLWRSRAGNDDPELAKELERFVEALMDQGKLNEAERILDDAITPDFARHPSSVYLVRSRVENKGRRGRWREAATDATLVVELDPSDPYLYHMLAVLLAMNHDRPAYGELCKKILTTFGSITEAFADDRMAQDCLLLPHSGADLQLVDKLADTAVIAAKGNDYALPMFLPCKAMSEYRVGRYAEAINWAEKSPTNSDTYELVQSCAVLTMAHWQLGQKDQAQAALDKGVKLTAGIFPIRDNEDLGKDWLSWVIARIELDEAAALIQAQPAVENGSN